MEQMGERAINYRKYCGIESGPVDNRVLVEWDMDNKNAAPLKRVRKKYGAPSSDVAMMQTILYSWTMEEGYNADLQFPKLIQRVLNSDDENAVKALGGVVRAFRRTFANILGRDECGRRCAVQRKGVQELVLAQDAPRCFELDRGLQKGKKVP